MGLDAIDDGDFYLSRCRVNRHVVTMNAGENGTVRLNGKVSKIIIDATQSAYSSGSGTNLGRFQLKMDVDDGDGSQLQYFDQITGLNYSGGGSNQIAYLEVSQGANQGTSNSHSGMHFAVSAPSTASAAGNTLNQAAAWNGLVCGEVTIVCDTASGTLNSANTIRVIIYLE